MSTGAPHATADLAVIGAGPAGTALAHRAAAAGLRVVLIDPDPLRPWSQTFGVFVDELPDWLSPECFASRSETITAYTPQRQVLPRPYAALDNTRLRAALSLSEVTIVTASSVHADARRVTLSDGST